MAAWQSLAFDECTEPVVYTAKVQRKDFLSDGAYPIVSQEEAFINGFWDQESDLFKVERPVVVFGDHTRVLKYIDFDFVLGADGVKVLKPKPFLDPRFFYYQLHTAKLESLGYARHYRLLKEHKVAYPPLPEQRRIVVILDEAFEAIATAKANTEKNLQNARDLFASYARNTFLEGEHRWSAKTLDRIATNMDSKRNPITKDDRKAGAYPYYGASGIVDYVADYIFDGDTLLISEDGANLLARSTPIAFPASGRYWVNNHAHILKFDHMATQRFVEFFLESIPLDEYITGAAQPKLNQKALNSIPIPLPATVIEQAQVVDQLDALAMESELLRGMYERKLTALDELKKSLLHQAFSGALTVKSTDQQLEALA